MQDKRYYSVSYDERNYPEIKMLRRKHGGIIAYGRWETLKQLLYGTQGALNLNNGFHVDLMLEELEFDNGEELESFLSTCAGCGLIDLSAYERDMIISPEVAENLAFIKAKSDAGKASAEARKHKREQEKEKK